LDLIDEEFAGELDRREVEPGTPAALIHPHDTPWREPAAAAFTRAGTVICKRVPSRVERGDCLFHLADDFVP
jgi:predicted deacylase